eukprot:NODE_427_length_8836_cov_0.452215.p6 type:complete len:122 gc:universal NODE_427_length_8836_cov_0.452215:8135-8500(+)
MGGRVSKPIAKASQAAQKPTAVPDMGHEIASNMSKLDIHAFRENLPPRNNKFIEVKNSSVDIISINNCKLLFKDAKQMGNHELADKYRLSHGFVSKLTKSYEWPEYQKIEKPVTSKFGRTL